MPIHRRRSRLAAALLALLADCDCGRAQPRPAPVCARAGLVAAVADGAHVLVQRDEGRGWVVEKRLPPGARALRFSPDGAHVAWVEDVRDGAVTTPFGFVWRADASEPVPLGPLGLRKRETMGLAVSREGRVVSLSLDGRLVDAQSGRSLGKGGSVLLGAPHEAAWIDERGCLQSTGLTFETLCDSSLRLLDLRGGRLLARTNGALFRLGPDGAPALPRGEIIDARRGPAGALLLIQRVVDVHVSLDAVLIESPRETRQIAQAAVVVSAEWDEDGTVLLVRRTSRRDLYELMLAHAPEEFGGEAADGEALRYDPATGTERPVAGLELKRVRALFRAN